MLLRYRTAVVRPSTWTACLGAAARSREAWLARICAFVVVAGAVAAYGKESQDACNARVWCGLDPAPDCSAEVWTATAAEQQERCRILSALRSRGYTYADTVAPAVLDALGRKYQVRYIVTGRSAMSASDLAWALEHLDIAAGLLNAGRNEDFRVRYIRVGKRTYVDAAKGDRFYGRATRLVWTPPGMRQFWYGIGGARILRWSFRGEVLLDIGFVAAPDGGVAYRFEIAAGPQTAWLHAIMDTALFRYVLDNRITAMVDALALALVRARREPTWALAAAPWRPEQRRNLAAWLAGDLEPRL